MGGFSGGPPGTVTPGGPPGTGRRPVASAQKERVFDPNFATVAPRVDLEAPDIPIFDPRGGWSAVVDWWFSHDIPTEDLPSGGGLMIGPQEAAKGLNFLKDALLPLMAGDIGLAGVAGLGPFDPLPIPGGKIVAKGADVAKGAGRAIRGAVRGADEAVEAVARTVVGETAPTLDAFTEMAGRGKLHPATGRDLPGEATATNPFEFGVINGYSEDDIAHFYLALRAPWNKARTAKNVGAVRDDMRELAYEQFLEDRAEYVAKQSGAPLGSTHRQLSDEIGKADVVRGESGEMMLEVDDVEAFDAALKAWEEANPVTPFTEAMERLDPPAGGVARETGEATARAVRSLDELDQVAVEAWGGGPPLFHGSGAVFDEFDPSLMNLDLGWGRIGVYTSNMDWAGGVARETGFVHNVRFRPNRTPRIVELRGPIPDDIRAVLRAEVEGLRRTFPEVDSLTGDESISALLAKIENPDSNLAGVIWGADVQGTTPTSITTTIGRFGADVPEEAYQTVLERIQRAIQEKGVDGYREVNPFGKPDPVFIWLNPSDLEVVATGARNVAGG